MVCAPNQALAYHKPWVNQASAWALASASWSEAKTSAASAGPASMESLPETGAAAACCDHWDGVEHQQHQQQQWQQQQQQQTFVVLHQQTVQKEKMKLLKKLQEIQKIEQLMATGVNVHRLQAQKIGKKHTLVAQLESIEQIEENKLRSDADKQHLTKSLEVMSEDHNTQQVVQIGNNAELHEEMPQLQPQELQHQQQQQNAGGTKSATTRRRERRKRAEKNYSAAGANAATPQESTEEHAASTSAVGRADMLLDRLQGDGAERREALQALHGSVVEQAFSAGGCRTLQQALQVADLETASKLLAELHGHVRSAAESPHANYVVQRIVELMPPVHSSFVVNELKGASAYLARHRYGCRIFCRLVEHSMGGEDFTELMSELLVDALGLSRHQFGHYVMQSVLEHGSQEHRKQLVAALCNDIRQCAQHRWASHVIETALSYCAPEEQRSIAVSLGCLDQDAMVSLALTQYGSFVMKALIRVPGEPGRVAWAHVQNARAQLTAHRYGQRVLESGAQGFREA